MASKCCRVTVAQTTTIPQGQEVLVSGQLHVRLTGIKQGLIEPTGRFVAKDNGMLIGRTFSNIGENNYVPIRVMNLKNEPSTLYKGTQVAVLQPATELSSDNPTDGANNELYPELQEMYERCAKELTLVQKKEFREILSNHQDVFSKSGELGRTSVVYHDIETGSARPIRQPARRLPHHQRAEAQKQIEEMLEKGVISPSNSPWANPVVLVKKKDGSTRFCVDYRKLNDLTYKDAYPLPRIDDSLDTLCGSKWFSSLDLASGYWQVEVNPNDKCKTACTTGTGLYEFNVMPFGLCNAPSTFERLMERVLSGLHWQTCLVYIDDILIFAPSFEEHSKRLSEVFNRLSSAGLKLKPKKCHLYQKEVLYLGHVVSSKGVTTDPEKTRKILDWPTPSNLKEVRSFLGLCSYYRRFVKNFAHIATPLHKLTHKDVQFKWTVECDNAFKELKNILTSADVLAYPDFSEPFILDTDASDHGIAGVLSQIQGGQEKVIAYGSRKLSKSEKNYSVTKKELLAVVHFVKYYKHYLYGKKFKIRTDHGSLRWLCHFKDPQGQLARWIETLAAFDYEISYRPGSQHNNADSLSRMPFDKSSENIASQTPLNCCSVSTVFAGWDLVELREAQQKDQVLAPVIQWKKNSAERPPGSSVAGLSRETKGYWYLWDQLELKQGILYRRFENNLSGYLQVVVPTSLQKSVLYTAHNVKAGAHLGQRKTFGKIRRSFYWIGCRNDVANWVRCCENCAKRKMPIPKKHSALQPSLVGAPFERIAMDILGPLPRSRRGNRYILVIMDYFTKWAEAFPLRNQEAETVARVLVEQFICRYGVPISLHTDQGSNFESNLFQNVCKLLGINKTRTTAYHPQSDGLVERFNRTLQTMLSMYVCDDQSDWDTHIPYVMMSYRASEQETTGVSPNRMMFGREVMLPLDLLVAQPSLENEYVNAEAYASQAYSNMQKAFEVARNHIVGEQKRQKRLYDAKLKGNPYKAGDKVWLYRPLRKMGVSPKLQSYWAGPYIVNKRISDAVYRIKNIKTGQRIVIHFDRLKPCYSSSSQQLCLTGDQACTNTTDEDDGSPASGYFDRPAGDRISRDASDGPDIEAESSSTPGSQDSNDGSGMFSNAEVVSQGESVSSGLSYTDKEEEQHLDNMDDWTGRTYRPCRQRKPPAWMQTGNYVI